MLRMDILVVDDERAVRDSLRRALELEGYRVELAEDGEDALRRLSVEPEPGPAVPSRASNWALMKRIFEASWSSCLRVKAKRSPR